MKKIIYISGGILLTVIIAGIISVQILKKRGLPDYNSNISLKGLSGKVEVFRDKYGVPSIYAQNQHDLYKATGYLMAQDRIWQIDLLRRVTTGRLSEIFGESMVDVDETFRMLQIENKSRKVYAALTPEEISYLKDFSDGINQYLDDNMDNLPLEFLILGYKPEKWEPAHSINLIGYMAWDLSIAWSTEVVAQKVIDKLGFKMYSHLMPDPSRTKSHIIKYTDSYKPLNPETASLDNEALNKISKAIDFTEDNGLNIFRGSNNWAVSGKKTSTGKPVLANDMHLSFGSPGIWYQIHQHAPGIHVTGLALPGAPFVIAGHNEKIAWGMTNVTVDDADFYEEHVKNDKDGNPVEYEHNGKWHKIRTEELKIKVKGKDQPVIRALRFTGHGPIISSMKKVKDKAISMEWIGNHYSNELRGVSLLNRASNWADFTKAISNFKAVSQNIVYADIEGNIGMYTAAGIAIRQRQAGAFVYEGWNSRYDWKGFVPVEKQPHELNPACGVLASANNKTTGNDYPYYISMWFYPPYRYDRIVQVLMDKEKLSMEEHQKLQMDQISLMAKDFITDMLMVVEQYKSSGGKNYKEIEPIYTRFKNWNFSMDKKSSEALLFEQYYNLLIRNTLSDEMGDELYREFINNRSSTLYTIEQLKNSPDNPWFDDIKTKDIKESKKDIIIRVLAEIAKSGNGSKSWGDVHSLTLKHPLGSVKALNFLFGFNRGPFDVGGSFHTVSPYSYKLDKDYNTDTGASHRHIFDLADWDNSRVVIPTGQSGIIGSPHYLDQTEDYLKGLYHPAWFSKEKVQKNAAYKMTFN